MAFLTPQSRPFYKALQYLKDDIYPEAILSRNCAIVAFWTFWFGKEPRLKQLIGQIAKLLFTTTWLWRDTWGHHWAWSRERRRCLRRCKTGEGGFNCLVTVSSVLNDLYICLFKYQSSVSSIAIRIRVVWNLTFVKKDKSPGSFWFFDPHWATFIKSCWS